MTKVLLIVYMLGGGSTTQYNTQFTFQSFQTIEQCEAIVEQMERMKNKWHYGDNKENVIPVLYSTKCVEIPGFVAPVPDKTVNPPTEPKTPTIMSQPINTDTQSRNNRRWNDIN